MLLSMRAGGAGLNLVGAPVLVTLDFDWNPATIAQVSSSVERRRRREERRRKRREKKKEKDDLTREIKKTQKKNFKNFKIGRGPPLALRADQALRRLPPHRSGIHRRKDAAARFVEARPGRGAESWRRRSRRRERSIDVVEKFLCLQPRRAPGALLSRRAHEVRHPRDHAQEEQGELRP